MADSNEKLIESLRKAAEELRKEAASIREQKPVVKFAGFSVDKAALKELIANEGR